MNTTDRTAKGAELHRKDVELYQAIQRALSRGSVHDKLLLFKFPIDDAINEIWLTLQKYARREAIQNPDAYVRTYLSKLADRLIDREKKHRRQREGWYREPVRKSDSSNARWAAGVRSPVNSADPVRNATTSEVLARIAALPIEDQDALHAFVSGRRNDPRYPSAPDVSRMAGCTASEIRVRGAAVLRKLTDEFQ